MASAAFRMTPGHDLVAGAVLLKHASIFVEVSQKTLVLEVRIFSFRGSLAENARFGSPELHLRSFIRYQKKSGRNKKRYKPSKSTTNRKKYAQDLA